MTRQPIHENDGPEEIAFRREAVVRLQDCAVVGEEWLLDHILPEKIANWLVVVMAMTDRVPSAKVLPGNWIAVNANADQLTNRYFQPLWYSLARRCVQSGKQLVLEWTEYAPGDPSAALLLDSLKNEFGVQISIDDVGSPGADGLWRMASVQVDWIKIDGALFQRAARDSWVQDTLCGLIEAAKTRSIQTIIEWIETPEHLALAKAMGATHGQGFFFSAQPKK